MVTGHPLLFVSALVIVSFAASLAQEQSQVQQVVPDGSTPLIRERRSPQFGGLFGHGGGHRVHHSHAGSHIKKHTSTYGFGPFYASYTTHHANTHAQSSGPYKPYHGHNYGPYHGSYHRPYYGHYNGYGGYSSRPYSGAYSSAGFRPGYGGGYNSGYHSGGLFNSFLDF